MSSTESTALVTLERVENELATLPKIKAEDLFVDEIITPVLGNIEALVRSVPQDISTAKGRQEIISLAAKVCSTKTFIDGVRMKLTEGWRTQTATVNASGKKSKERLQKLQDETRQPMTEWENIEKERVAKLELGIGALEAFGTFEYSVTTEEIAVRLDNLEHCTTDSFEDFSRRAEAAKQGSLDKLRSMLAVSQHRDKERAELEALRQQAAERAQQDRDAEIARKATEVANAKAESARVASENKIKADAAESARIAREAAEKAEREKREAEERAAKSERDRLQAIEDARIAGERAKADAEAAKLQAEAYNLAMELKAETDRLAAEAKAKQDITDALEAKRVQDEATAEAERKAQEKRENNARHRTKVHNDAVAAFVENGVDAGTANVIVILIAEGKIANVHVQY